MGDSTGIAWTDHTFNPWWGCEKVSAGCKFCYAEGFAVGRMKLPIWGGAETERRFFGDGHWKEPERWNRAAEKAGKRARVFCASMADVFEDRPDLVAPRARLAALVAATPSLIWQLLTKRPENAQRLWVAACPFAQEPTEADDELDADPGYCVCGEHSCADGWLPTIWLGTTVEDQAAADARIPHLLRVPAAVRFLSCEPLLGPVNLREMVRQERAGEHRYDALVCDVDAEDDGDWQGRTVNWIILGGESGPKARPCDLAWMRSIAEQARAAGVPVFWKQLGPRPFCSRGPGTAYYPMRDSHGGDVTEWPVELAWTRDFPEVRP